MSEKRYMEVQIDGTTHRYQVPPRVEIRFEKDMKMALPDVKKVGDIYRLAWMAAQNAGVEESFDQWIDRVDDIVWKKSGGDAPLDEAPPSGTSQPLPSPPA